MTVEGKEKRPNWILRAMIAVSLGVHLVVFMEIADIYRSENQSVIELTVRDEEPPARSIPRPPTRHKMPEARDVERIDVAKPHIPDVRMDPVETETPDPLSEAIAVPDTSGLAAGLSDWAPAAPVRSEYLTRKDYFDMLRLKIESRKEYPASAQNRQVEGRVVVGFTLAADGSVQSASVVESSGHRALDRAAVNAVKAAAPFPRPPSTLFSGPLQMVVPIMFELT